MNPHLVLILGFFGLGAILTCWFWHTTRVPLFQLRLKEIRDELEVGPSPAEGPGHESYAAMRRAIDQLIEFAPYISPSVLILYSRLATPPSDDVFKKIFEPFVALRKLGANDDPPEVQIAVRKLAVAVCLHTMLTPGFLAFLLYLAIFSRSKRFASTLGKFGISPAAATNLAAFMR